MIRAIFFDIDGTLYSHTTRSIPESTLTALHELRKKGILLFIATGRHISDVRTLPLDLSFDGYVALNGQICLDKDEEILYAAPIAQPDAQYMITAFEKKELPIVLVEKDRVYSNFTGNETGKIAVPPEYVPETGTYTGGKIYQFIVFGDESTFEALMLRLPNCKMTRWNPHGVDIISKEGGKIVGIHHFLQHFQIRQDEIIAFGDGENDIEMLRFAGIGIAMGNADDMVKKHADHVTESVDSDGIYKALVHYGLI